MSLFQTIRILRGSKAYNYYVQEIEPGHRYKDVLYRGVAPAFEIYRVGCHYGLYPASWIQKREGADPDIWFIVRDLRRPGKRTPFGQRAYKLKDGELILAGGIRNCPKPKKPRKITVLKPAFILPKKATA